MALLLLVEAAAVVVVFMVVGMMVVLRCKGQETARSVREVLLCWFWQEERNTTELWCETQYNTVIVALMVRDGYTSLAG